MSRLQTLLDELCPDGVKYVALGEVAHYSASRIDASNVDKNTYVGVDNLLPEKQGKTVSNYVPAEGRLVRFETGDILIGNIRPYLKKIWLSDTNGGTNGDVLVIQIEDKRMLTPAFLYYVLSSDSFFDFNMQNAKGAKMPRGDKASIMNYIIPVPPLPVQVEIVRILDAFKELTVELIDKLSVELSARRKQYEYYRDSLLSFDVHLGMANILVERTIGDLAETFIGLATSVTKHKSASGVPLIHNSDIQQNAIVLKSVEFISEEFANQNAKKRLRKNDIITVHTGDVGTSAVVDERFVGAIGFTTITSRIRDDSVIMPVYLCHYLNSRLCKSRIASMTISDRSNLNQSNFEKLMIPVPPLDEQRRIVAILDRFDALCNDLTSGLPAELAARRKQYEYYRDRLLSFQALDA